MKRTIKNIVKYGAFSIGFLMFTFIVLGIILTLAGVVPETPVVEEKDNVRKPKPKPVEKVETVEKPKPKLVEKETPKTVKLSEIDIALRRAQDHVLAKTLFKEYDNNAIAATAKYKGKLISVTGVIEDFSVVLLDVSIVSLETGEMFQTVNCEIKSELVPYVSKLNKGDIVVVVGVVDSEFIGTVTVKDCLIELVEKGKGVRPF